MQALLAMEPQKSKSDVPGSYAFPPGFELESSGAYATHTCKYSIIVCEAHVKHWAMHDTGIMHVKHWDYAC